MAVLRHNVRIRAAILLGWSRSAALHPNQGRYALGAAHALAAALIGAPLMGALGGPQQILADIVRLGYGRVAEVLRGGRADPPVGGEHWWPGKMSGKTKTQESLCLFSRSARPHPGGPLFDVACALPVHRTYQT